MVGFVLGFFVLGEAAFRSPLGWTPSPSKALVLPLSWGSFPGSCFPVGLSTRFVAPTTLFFNYLFFNYLYVLPEWTYLRR